ncbi:LUD domain-containing protein [Halorutilales archaeon Cl-col2-1]
MKQESDSDSDSSLDEFEKRLADLGVGVTAVPRSDLSDAVDDATEGTAVASSDLDGSLLPDYIETQPSDDEIRDADTGITRAEFGVASYGTLGITSEARSSQVSLYPDRHVAVLRRDDLVEDIETALELVDSADTDVVLATGVSSTSDMGESVRGVHGVSTAEVVVVE